jgi:hypothetical protein
MTNMRDDALVPLTPNETHVDKEGYAVKASSGKAALVTAVNDDVLGVITDGKATAGFSTVAIAGAYGGTLKVKLDATPGTIVLGSRLAVTATGTFKLDPATGNRCVCARALESGVADELIEAVLTNPAVGS